MVRRTARAELDLLDIWLHVAQDDIKAADRLVDEIDATASLLATQPLMGRARPDIAPDLRYLPVGNYLLLYRVDDDGMELVRVVHGARRLENLL